MKILLKQLVSALLAIVFVPLILVLFFLFPVEFCVASWQLAHLDGQTTGEVLESSVSYFKGGSRSDIRYLYLVEGKEYVSNCVRVGFLSGSSYETGGGDLAAKLKPGMTPSVYYSKADPRRSVLEYGWPKWSIGFSLVVWGLACGQRFKRGQHLIGYAVTRAMTLSGFVCIVLLFRPTFYPRDWWPFAGVMIAACLGCLAWGAFRRRADNRAMIP
jgi:hypothetical protein